MEPNTKYLKRKHISKFLGSAQYLGKRGVLSNDYDEPTYVGFWVEFDFLSSSLNSLDFVDYNRLPNGLLGDEKISPSPAERYLRDIGEPRKADMIKAFNRLLRDITKETPEAITSVSGLDTVYRIDPSKNWRAADSEITLNFNDAIDNRITALFDLYRKAAFDDNFMRWALPDIHRFFKMNIYVTEFRSFHIPRSAERKTDSDNVVSGQRSAEIYNDIGDRNTGRSFINQKVDGYQDQLGNVEKSIQRATESAGGSTGNPLSPGSFFNDREAVGAGDYFLTVLDRNLSILKFELSECEIILPELLPSWTQELSNQEAGESVSASMKIKVGRVCEVNEYSALGASLFEGLNNIKERVLSCKFKNEKFDLDKYFEVLGDSSRLTADSVYSDPNYPYGKGHLSENNDFVQSIGERLLESSLNFAEGQITNFASEQINNVFLGNVYDGSASTIIRSLAADPRALGNSLSQILNNANGPENTQAITSNIQLNIPTDPNLIKSRDNIRLEFKEKSQENPGSADIRIIESQDQNLENASLNTPQISSNNLGNVGIVSNPSSSTIDEIDIVTPEKNESISQNIELKTNDAISSGDQSIELNYQETDTNIEENINLQDVPVSSKSIDDNVNLEEPNISTEEPGSTQLEYPESNSQDIADISLEDVKINQANPGNIDLQINTSQSDVADVNLRFPDKSEENLDNVGINIPDKSEENLDNSNLNYPKISQNEDQDKINLKYPPEASTTPSNIGLDNIDNTDNNISVSDLKYPVSSLDNEMEDKIELKYTKNNSKTDENVNLKQVEKENIRPQPIKLKYESSPDAEKENINLKYTHEKERVPEKIILKSTESKNDFNNKVELKYQKNLNKKKPDNIVIDADYLKKQNLEKIDLASKERDVNPDIKMDVKYQEHRDSSDKSVDINHQDTQSKDSLGNIYSERKGSQPDIEKNVGINYREHETFPKEGSEIQSTKPLKKRKPKNE